MEARYSSRVTVRKPFAIAGIIAPCVILLSLLENVQTAARLSAFGSKHNWLVGMADSLGTWSAVAAMTPLVYLLARRFPIARPRLARHLALHGLASLVFALLASTCSAAVLVSSRNLAFTFMFVKVASFYSIFFAVVYWAVVGAAHARESRREARARELASAQLQETLTRERLEVLRGKLNPHFLFNTLNAISTMALQRDHEGVVESLGLVGEMLRVTLDDALPQEIPLSRELAFTEKYLAVQHLRFGDRLQIERDIDDATHDALVPSLLLQPLVENAIQHGVAAIPGAGRVRIDAHAEDGLLRIRVSDSGPGFAAVPRNGIGLASTRERLAALYGDAARVDIGNAEGGGATVTITLPRRA